MFGDMLLFVGILDWPQSSKKDGPNAYTRVLNVSMEMYFPDT